MSFRLLVTALCLRLVTVFQCAGNEAPAGAATCVALAAIAFACALALGAFDCKFALDHWILHESETQKAIAVAAAIAFALWPLAYFPGVRTPLASSAEDLDANGVQ